MSLSGLLGALLPCSSSFWWCQVTQICYSPFGPSSWRGYWIVPSHQIQLPVWSLRKGCWTFEPFWTLGTFRAGVVLVFGGRMTRMLDLDRGRRSSGADAGLVGRVGGGG